MLHGRLKSTNACGTERLFEINRKPATRENDGREGGAEGVWMTGNRCARGRTGCVLEGRRHALCHGYGLYVLFFASSAVMMN